MAVKFDVSKHVLVPKHIKISDKEKKQLLSKYNITEEELAQININDAALSGMKINVGDVIKIERKSPNAGAIEFYRCVVND